MIAATVKESLNTTFEFTGAVGFIFNPKGCGGSVDNISVAIAPGLMVIFKMVTLLDTVVSVTVRFERGARRLSTSPVIRKVSPATNGQGRYCQTD